MKKYGGGMLNNWAAHFIDALLHILGTGDWDLYCRLLTVASAGDADDVVKVCAQTAKGVVIDLEINCASAIEVPTWTLYFKRGTAYSDPIAYNPEVFRLKYFEREDTVSTDLNESLAATDRKYPHNEIAWKDDEIEIEAYPEINYYDYCYDYFALGKEPFVPLSQTKKVVELQEKCRSSSGGR